MSVFVNLNIIEGTAVGNLFGLDFRKIIIVLLIFALPLVSIQFQRAPGETPWYMQPIQFVVNETQHFYSNFSNAVRTTTSTYLDLIQLRKELEAVKDSNGELRAQLLRFDELNLENQRLTGLLDFRSKMKEVLIPAKVIGQDLMSGQRRSLRIDKGTEAGIVKGQAVIHPDGVVGYVLESFVGSATILVLTDRYCVVDALVQRTRARGLVEGRTENIAQLKYLHRSDDVQAGDIVVTSGLDLVFPAGFPIGIVTQVEKRAYDVTQKVEIEPLVKLSRMEDVFVVLRPDGPPPLPTPPAHPEKRIPQRATQRSLKQ